MLECSLIATSWYHAVKYSRRFEQLRKQTLLIQPLLRGVFGVKGNNPASHALASGHREYLRLYNAHFEKLRRATIQVYMNATVRRQQYYNEKLKYVKVENILAQLSEKVVVLSGSYNAIIREMEIKLQESRDALADAHKGDQSLGRTLPNLSLTTAFMKVLQLTSRKRKLLMQLL